MHDVSLENIYNYASSHETKLSLTVFDDCVWINRIIVKQTGKGIGGTLIRMLQEYCQKRKLNIKLLACNCYGTPLNVLKEIYRHLGFHSFKEKNSSSEDYMIWEYTL